MRVLYAHCGQVLAARGRFSNLMINRLTLNQVLQPPTSNLHGRDPPRGARPQYSIHGLPAQLERSGSIR